MIRGAFRTISNISFFLRNPCVSRKRKAVLFNGEIDQGMNERNIECVSPVATMASNVPSTPTSQLSDKRINENENVLARNENTPAKPSTFCLRYILRIDSIRNQHRGYLGW